MTIPLLDPTTIKKRTDAFCHNAIGAHCTRRHSEARRIVLSFVAAGILFAFSGPAHAQGILTVTPSTTITTLAGTGSTGYTGDGSAAPSANLAAPSAVAYDAAGNLFFADAQNHVVREVSKSGQMSTVAGNGLEGYGGDNAPATAATLDTPTGVAVDATGNIYIADSHNHCIRKVSGGTITTIAGTGVRGFSGDGGAATEAQLWLPSAVAVDATGNVYVADTNNQRIRKITGSTITTIAGNGEELFAGDTGAATAAVLDSPTGVAVDTVGNVYIADRHNQRIRMVTPGGTISTIAGSGAPSFSGAFAGDGATATAATLARPSGVSIDASGNIFIADTNNQRIREISGGIIATVAGSSQQGFGGDAGAATNAILNAPRAVTAGVFGNLVIADKLNQRLRNTIISSLSFANSGVGILSTPQSVTLANTGSAPITVRSIAFTGAFTTAAGGSCSAMPITLAAGANCTQNIAFLPTVFGTATGSVAFSGTGVIRQSILLSGSAIQAATSVGLTSNVAAPFVGQPIILTAAVKPTGIGTPTGTVSFYDGTTLLGTGTFSAGSASLTASLARGPHTFTAVYAGDTNFTGNTSPALVETANQGITSVALLSNFSTPFAGQPVTFTATLTAAGFGTPTGVVSLYDGGTLIATAQVVASAASFTTTLAAGPQTVTAVYAGDTNFAGSSSPILGQLVTDFSFTLSSSALPSLIVEPGQTASYAFSMQPIAGAFPFPVTLSATGLPPGATVTFTPQTITLGASTANFIMAIKTAATGASLTPHSLFGGSSILLSLMLLPFSSWTRRRLRGMPRLMLCITLLFSLAGISALTGCGTGSGFFGQSAQTYTINIIGSAAGAGGAILQHSTSVTLTVQ